MRLLRALSSSFFFCSGSVGAGIRLCDRSAWTERSRSARVILVPLTVTTVSVGFVSGAGVLAAAGSAGLAVSVAGFGAGAESAAAAMPPFRVTVKAVTAASPVAKRM